MLADDPAKEEERTLQEPGQLLSVVKAGTWYRFGNGAVQGVADSLQDIIRNMLGGTSVNALASSFLTKAPSWGGTWAQPQRIPLADPLV